MITFRAQLAVNQDGAALPGRAGWPVEMDDLEMPEDDKLSGTPGSYPFGDCPHCEKKPMVANIEREHWFYCADHQVKWCVGSNLLSAWRYESPAVWGNNAKMLAEFATIEEYHRPEKDKMPALVSGPF